MSNGIISVKKRDPALAGKMMTKGYEGWRSKAYNDPGGKNRAIGYGFNYDEPNVFKQLPKEVATGNRSLTKVEAEPIFNALYDQAANTASKFAGKETWGKLSAGQKNVITDMAYNMGGPTLNKFVKFKANLKGGDYANAAKELKNSKWYGQVGNRSKNHYLQIQK